MQIQVKCYATLSRFTPADADAYSVAEGTTVGDVMDSLGVARADVKLAFVNGVKVEPETVLNDGDRLGFFPAVGGG